MGHGTSTHQQKRDLISPFFGRWDQWDPKYPTWVYSHIPSLVPSPSLAISWYILIYLDISWYILTYLDISWHILTYLDISWHILTYLDISWHILTYLDISWHILTYLDISWHILTYLDISWYILIYLDISWYVLIYLDISWYILIYLDISWYILIYLDMSWYVLIYLDISWYILIYLDISWYILIYLDISWYILIYLDISWYILIYLDAWWLLRKHVKVKLATMRRWSLRFHVDWSDLSLICLPQHLGRLNHKSRLVGGGATPWTYAKVSWNHHPMSIFISFSQKSTKNHPPNHHWLYPPLLSQLNHSNLDTMITWCSPHVTHEYHLTRSLDPPIFVEEISISHGGAFPQGHGIRLGRPAGGGRSTGTSAAREVRSWRLKPRRIFGGCDRGPPGIFGASRTIKRGSFNCFCWIWLVVSTYQPLWKMMDLKSLGMMTFTIYKKIKCSKPPTSDFIGTKMGDLGISPITGLSFRRLQGGLRSCSRPRSAIKFASCSWHWPLEKMPVSK